MIWWLFLLRANDLPRPLCSPIFTIIIKIIKKVIDSLTVYPTKITSFTAASSVFPLDLNSHQPLNGDLDNLSLPYVRIRERLIKLTDSPRAITACWLRTHKYPHLAPFNCVGKSKPSHKKIKGQLRMLIFPTLPTLDAKAHSSPNRCRSDTPAPEAFLLVETCD